MYPNYVQNIPKSNKITFQKLYKQKYVFNINNLRIVSMIPSDRKVAGCFYISNHFLGVFK